MKRELDMKFQQSMDEEKRSDVELSKLKAQVSSSSSAAAAARDTDHHQYQFKAMHDQQDGFYCCFPSVLTK